jgi:hypothetical protein
MAFNEVLNYLQIAVMLGTLLACVAVLILKVREAYRHVRQKPPAGKNPLKK